MIYSLGLVETCIGTTWPKNDLRNDDSIKDRVESKNVNEVNR